MKFINIDLEDRQLAKRINGRMKKMKSCKILKGLSYLDKGDIICTNEITSDLRDTLKDESILKVFHDASSNVSFLNKLGYEVNNIECTKVMAQVLGEKEYSLKSLAEKHLISKFNINTLKDVEIIKYLYLNFKQELKRKNLVVVFERENRANNIVPKLNNQGIRFDYTNWNKELDEDRKKMEELEAEIKIVLQNNNLNLQSSYQLLRTLQKNDINIPDTDDSTLAQFEDKYLVISLIRKYRKKYVKVKTYGENLEKAIGVDGRVRGEWQIIGAASGRMTCRNPPLQGFPSASKKFFIPDKCNKFVIGDYSQIELRVLASISEDKTLLDQFQKGIDLHTGTASLIFGKDMLEVTQEERHIAKSLNFGMAYGITKYGIQKNLIKVGLNTSLEEAEQYRLQFLAVYPQVRQLQNLLLQAISVNSLGGRQWDCKDLKPTQRLNYPIQGSAADGFKEALILLYDQLKDNWKVCAVVHDEIVLEVPECEAEIAKDMLEKCMKDGM